jgi:hypothetical protein
MTRFARCAVLPLALLCTVLQAAPAQKAAAIPKETPAAGGAVGSVIDFREGAMPAIVFFEEKGTPLSVVVAPPATSRREPLAPLGSIALSAPSARPAATPKARR